MYIISIACLKEKLQTVQNAPVTLSILIISIFIFNDKCIIMINYTLIYEQNYSDYSYGIPYISFLEGFSVLSYVKVRISFDIKW